MPKGMACLRTLLTFVNSRFLLWGLLAFTLFLTLCNRKLSAQVLFGSMVGSVTDASGAAVPAATVNITEMSTNETRTVPTNDAGAYTVSTLPAGTYQVEIAKTGFRGFLTS